MTFDVVLTDAAALDLEMIYQYICRHDVKTNADYVLDQFERAFNSLSTMPERGTYLKELMTLGIREYREIFFKPYRLIYRIIENTVYIYLIADGRRDMQTLLQQRLLTGV